MNKKEADYILLFMLYLCGIGSIALQLSNENLVIPY